MDVKTGGTIEISPSIKLPNCLYVPSLSHKLLSISHVTKELNCSVPMHPTFCLLQDIITGRIIGCGTEREGLYYVDEVTTSGTVMLAHGTSEREAWLWHRRLGHPSEQSSPNISATKDTIPNLIFEVSNSQLSDSLDEILENIHETVGVQEHEEPTPIEVPENYSLLARSNRGIPPKRYTTEKASRSSKYPIANIARGNLFKEAKAFFASLYLKKTPSNVEQASKSNKWKNAMDVEMDALMRNGTWDKCILLQEKKPVRCHWIFTIKYKPDECILTWRIKRRSIYGGPAWILLGFQTWRSLHRGDRVTCLIIYVDDMIITGNDESEIKKLKEGLCAELEMKELGNLRYFLGIKVMRSQQGIFICQKKYILDLLAETGMIDCKPTDTPMITNQKLFMKTKAKLADRDRYQRMVEKIIYMSHTHLDIAYAVGVMSQFMHQPR
ncbi:putative ribonuclease H-like domain-containing protein [Tanacetum coccineum]